MAEFNRENLIAKMSLDRFAFDTVGIEILDITPKSVRTRLSVEERHLNGVGIAQGGALFTLADFTFAIASNIGEFDIVGIEANISYMKPARVGDVLVAESREIHRSKSLAGFEVMVTNQENAPIARFYGRGFVRDKR